MAGVLGLVFGTGGDKSRSNSDIMIAPQQHYVASIDQGTSSSRCIVFGRDGSIVSEHQMEHEQFYPQPGRVEHDADEIWVSAEPIPKVASCVLSIRGTSTSRRWIKSNSSVQ